MVHNSSKFFLTFTDALSQTKQDSKDQATTKPAEQTIKTTEQKPKVVEQKPKASENKTDQEEESDLNTLDAQEVKVCSSRIL